MESSTSIPLSDFRHAQSAVPVSFWAIVDVLWFSFGLSTILNRVAFSLMTPDLSADHSFPIAIQESIWLVLGIWISGYLAGMFIGVRGREKDRHTLVWSAIIGFEIMVLLRIIFLDAFPDGQQDAFGNIFTIFTLAGVPGYISFLFLSTVIGALLVGIAVTTGLILSQNQPKPLAYLSLDPRLLVTSILLPWAILLAGWGVLNILDFETLKELRQNPYDSTHLLHLDLFLNPATHMLIAALVGVLLGASPYARYQGSLLFTTSAGMMVYVLFIIVSKDLFMIYAVDTIEDKLNLSYPNAAIFGLLWYGPVFTGTLGAFAVYNLKISLWQFLEQRADSIYHQS
jgi:hypothetical protein